MIKILKEHTHLLLSTGIHTAILLILMLTYTEKKSLSPQIFSIPSYMTSMKQLKSLQSNSKNSVKNDGVLARHLAKRKTEIKANTANSKSTSYKNSINEDSKIALLRILHDAIAQQQEYPESAIRLQQAGTVKIGFILNPNGNLEKIEIIKPSSYKIINLAALSAVNAVSSISEASQYLREPFYFQVDVIFE
jgi:TonB family protein